MKITAAVLRGYSDPFTVEPVELRAGPGPLDILVRIAGTGMCHTDLAVRGSGGRSPLPAILGHEGAGVVVSAGAAVSGLDPGDHVVLSFDSCAQCPACLAGRPAYCRTFAPLNLFGQRDDDAGRFTDARGQPLAPRWFGQSSFAGHAVVRARNAVKVDPALPLASLGPLGCGFQTGAGAVLNTFAMGPGDTLAVMGAGAVGLGAVMAAVACAATVFAVDRHEGRLEVAGRLGATPVPAGSPDLAAHLAKLTGGGARYALDTTGDATMINAALASLDVQGSLGVVARQREPLTLLPGGLERGRRVTHICEGDAVPRLFIPRLIDLWRAGMFPFDTLVKTYPLAAVNDAERDSLAGLVVKPVLIPDDGGIE
jgi:aryl-alcohol dehydrogenase